MIKNEINHSINQSINQSIQIVDNGVTILTPEQLVVEAGKKAKGKGGKPANAADVNGLLSAADYDVANA